MDWNLIESESRRAQSFSEFPDCLVWTPMSLRGQRSRSDYSAPGQRPFTPRRGKTLTPKDEGQSDRDTYRI